MPRGASPKREHEYEELKHKFQKSGRYGGRAKEVAARIVNKQRSQHGETKGEKKVQREGRNPDRSLPLANYSHLTISQLKNGLGTLSKGDVRKIKAYEHKHKNRKGAMEAIDTELRRK